MNPPSLRVVIDKNNWIIHAALAAEAPWLVTGDEDLLVLSESVLSPGLRIISPAAASSLPKFLPSR